MHELEVNVLGPFEVVRDGSRIDVGGPKQRALLARLVAHPGRVVSVDRLVDELWGEAPPPGALTSLQAYVSRLRRLLEPGGAARDRGRLLVTCAPGYRLDLDPACIDAHRFTTLAAAGHAALVEGRFGSAAAALDDALGLWRGPAWGEFAADAFAVADVTRLDELHAAATEDRLAAAVELGDRSAVARLEAAVGEQPTRERLWGLLMVALYRSGRQGDALQAFQRARAALADLLGVDPSADLRRIEAQVLAQSPELDRPQAQPAAAPQQPSAPPAATPAPVGSPVVGRDPELGVLRRAVARATGGSGATVVVTGEPGIGKTRLLRAVAEEAAVSGVVVGWGGGVEGEQAPAFWPWTRALRQLVAELSPELVTSLSQSLAELGQLDPVFAELAGVPTPPPLADPELARVRAFRAAIRALETVAATAPVLLVLDDLQWADAPSLQLLTMAAHELEKAPVVLLAALRPDEVGAALSDARAAIARLASAAELRLSGLPVSEVGELVQETVGHAVPADVAAALLERTNGNPLFVTELARLLQQERVLDAASARQLPVPVGVRDVISRRLARLPEQTRTLLHLGAVVGRTFDLGLLEEVADVSVDDLLDRIEVAVALGVVSDAMGAAGDFTFAHDLVRDTLYSSLSTARRIRLHARVADALAAGGSTRLAARPFELAHHLEAAASVLPAERVVDGLAHAADAAIAQLDLDRAQSLLDRALLRVDAIEDVDVRNGRELSVRLRLGNLLSLSRGYAADEVGQHFRRAAVLVGEVPTGPDRLHAQWGVCVFTGVSGRFADVLDMARAALAETADPAAACAFSQIVGTFSWHIADLAAACAHLERAVELEDAHGLDLRAITLHDVAVAARSFHALAAWAQGRDAEADRLIADALRRADRLDDPFDRVVAMFFEEWLAALRGDRERVLELAGPVIELADTHGFSQYAPMARVLAAWAAGTDEAIDGLAAGLAAAAATGARMLGHFFLTLLGDALLRLDRVDDAAGALEQAYAESEATGEAFFAPETLRLLAEVAARRGDRGTALARLADARALAVRLGHDGLRPRIEASMTRVDTSDTAAVVT